jgi:hypothetical protein
MSDYLWDKTGEPEEDVAQLENLLGALKYQPRPLEVPETAMPPAATTAAARTTRPATIFSRPRLALAASLILTLLAGAWLFTREGEPQKNQLADIKQQSPASADKQIETAAVSNARTQPDASPGDGAQSKPREDETAGSKVSAAKPLLNSYPPVAKRGKPLPRVREKSYAPPSVVKRQKLTPRVEENRSAPREEVAVQRAMRWEAEQPLTPQQREATEKLMLALRLASAKFNYAQREMLEIGRAGN